jgi:hypothetical protein
VSVEGDLSVTHPETHAVVTVRPVNASTLGIDVPVELIPANPTIAYVPVALPPIAYTPETLPPTTSTIAHPTVMRQ